jgi:hypothetical protein
VVCNSGVGLTPVVAGKVHHFSAGGLYNGLVLLIDDETRTYWDHITGEAVHGELKGAKLENWPLEMTNVETALKNDPNLQVHYSKPTWIGRLMGWAIQWLPMRLPGFFRKTMGEPDNRQPEMEIGLGVVTDGVRRFYPKRSIGEGIDDEIEGRPLQIHIGEDFVPFATWDDGSRPLQLFTRWYGFASTYPGCEILGGRRGVRKVVAPYQPEARASGVRPAACS